ncbi:hypothetical protein D020_2302B, partial [Vibrio parahaemolyticus SBR10290]
PRPPPLQIRGLLHQRVQPQSLR